jgi:hypothetical protein
LIPHRTRRQEREQEQNDNSSGYILLLYIEQFPVSKNACKEEKMKFACRSEDKGNYGGNIELSADLLRMYLLNIQGNTQACLISWIPALGGIQAA